MMKNRGIAFKLSVFILSSCTAIFAITFGYNYLFSRRIITSGIEENAGNIVRATVNTIETVLCSVEKVPETLAYSLEQSSYSREELLDLLRSVIERNPSIYGGTIAFAPYAFDRGTQRFSPYFYKRGDAIEFTDLGKESYAYFEWDWYTIPQKLGRPVWTEPYFDEGGGNVIMSTYSVPFYKKADQQRKFMGIVTADISLTWLQDLVSSIRIGQTGYGFLVSRNGTIVTHPAKDLIMKETLFSLAETRNDARLREIGGEMTQGKSGFTHFRSILSGKECWMGYAPLPSTGWSLGVLFPQAELMADVTDLNREVVILGLVGFLFLLAVITLISRSITRPLRTLARSTREIAGGKFDFDLPPAKSEDEVGKLTASFISMRDELKNYIRELTRTMEAKGRMESELKIAHDIQMGIVPKIFPPFPDISEFDIYAVIKPAREVGGDFYDFSFIDGNHFYFVIGDVSGKGVPASLFMAVTATLIKTAAREMRDPEEIINRVNSDISRDNDACMFVTLFFGILNIRTGEIRYINGGHNPPLIMRGGKGPEFLEGVRNSAVGVFDEARYRMGKLLLKSGDILYMYTDGVTEALNKEKELFSEERLVREAALLRDCSVQDLVNGTLKTVSTYSRGMPQSDDITILALRYRGGGEKAAVTEEGAAMILKNDISEIPRLANAAAAFGRKSGLPDGVVHDMNLALEEVVSNIIFYAYEDAGAHQIRIHFGFQGDELVLTVRDAGRRFNPLEVPGPDVESPLEERKPGGLGIHFVRSVMDKLEYRWRGGNNIVTMRKKIREHHPPAE